MILYQGHHSPCAPIAKPLEVSGERRYDKKAKVAPARNTWVPAVNGLGRYGRWAFVELNDSETAKQELENFIKHGETRPIMIALKDSEME